MPFPDSPLTIYLTAFEPFGDSTVNASQVIAHRLSAVDERIILQILPVVRFEAQRLALSGLAEMAPVPRLYIALGEAGPEKEVRLEKVAVNWDHYRIADNGGNQPQDAPILPNGPAAYFAPFPIVAVDEALKEKTPVPVRISLTAGAFVCNHLAYTVSAHLSTMPVCPFCFIHVPKWRPEDGTEALSAIVKTVRAVINVALNVATK